MITSHRACRKSSKICGCARKSAEHYFGQRKYGEHTIALIVCREKISEPGGTRRKRSNLLTNNLLTNNLPYIHTYIHTLLSFHIPSCFVTHPLSHSTLSHTTVLTSRSFTTSFPFPSFSVPAPTFDAHYWKKLTCGVIRSFNFSMTVRIYVSSTYRLCVGYLYNLVPRVLRLFYLLRLPLGCVSPQIISSCPRPLAPKNKHILFGTKMIALMSTPD